MTATLTAARAALLIGLGILAAAPAVAASVAPTPRPNIVFILFDDLGYGESPAFRADCEFKTPNIDRLAREGMRFTDAHSASAVCTPTRYGVLTGRYPLRIGQDGVLTTFSGPIIRADDVTVGSLLQAHGYHTGCFGKWHLGMRWPAELARAGEEAVPLGTVVAEGPITRGFDTFLGFTHSRNMGMVIEQDRVVAKLEPVEVQPLLSERAAAYVSERAATGQPFFLYLPLAPPHNPIVPAEPYLGQSGAGGYGDWIFQGDAAVGRILAALDEAGVADETLVIVTSDNGAAGRSYAPLRAAKASIYEGGHRVPFVARWPGVIEQAATCTETICLNDLMATAAEILGAELPPAAGVDSFSLLPAFRGQPGPLREATIHQSFAGDRAIRQGDWKLVVFKKRGPDEAAKGLKKWSRQELYDLRSDLGEARDLATAQPVVAAKLRALLDETIARGRSRPESPGSPPPEPPGQPARKESGRPGGRPDQ